MTAVDQLAIVFNVDRKTGNVQPNIPAGTSIGNLLLIGKILDLILTDMMTKPQEDKLQIARVLPRELQ